MESITLRTGLKTGLGIGLEIDQGNLLLRLVRFPLRCEANYAPFYLSSAAFRVKSWVDWLG